MKIEVNLLFCNFEHKPVIAIGCFGTGLISHDDEVKSLALMFFHKVRAYSSIRENLLDRDLV